MALLAITAEEVEYIATTVDVNTYWPPVDSPWSKLNLAESGAGGDLFRLKFLQPFVDEGQGPYEIVVTRSELWLLDSALLPNARTKMSQGSPVTALMRKVGALLLQNYEPGEITDARSKNVHPTEDGTSGKTADGPERGEGAGEDMSTTG